MKKMVTCSVVGERCTAPAGWQVCGVWGGYAPNDDRRRQAKYECFACGLPVCAKCTRLIDYYNYGKQRICNVCRPNKIKGGV